MSDLPARALALWRAGFDTVQIAERLSLRGTHRDVYFRVAAAYPWTSPEARPDEAAVLRLIHQARAEERDKHRKAQGASA